MDLTELILRENDLKVNKTEFDQEMQQQKERSRSSAVVETDDWIILVPGFTQEFTGYDHLEEEVKIVEYRQIKVKGKIQFQLVFDKTPFYAESGGQVGDNGYLISGNERIFVLDTKKENNLTVHITEKLPSDSSATFQAIVNKENRINIENNHSATHLLHYALRQVLGNHVEQKGSLVHSDYLRFDFSHFQKLNPEELSKVELLVNQMIWQNLSLNEKRAVTFDEAKESGAMALFGEKYGDKVRVIKFGNSIELCGGTHVRSTGQIGLFRIVSEAAIAAGIRRIEAVSGEKAYMEVKVQSQILTDMHELLSVAPNVLLKSVENLLAENRLLKKDLDVYKREKLNLLRDQLINKSIEENNGIKLIVEKIEIENPDSGKDLIFDINRVVSNIIVLLASEIDGKAYLWLMVSENLVKEKAINAVEIIREISKEIQGGGGGQPFFANAGGKQPQNISKALEAG